MDFKVEIKNNSDSMHDSFKKSSVGLKLKRMKIKFGFF
jgi:hypothetical protein